MTTLTASKKSLALDTVMPYEEKRRLMVLTVLREECGRETKKRAFFNKEEFDWKKHNESFNKDYRQCSLEELLQLCKFYYGLNDIDAVQKRRIAHKEQAARMRAKYALT